MERMGHTTICVTQETKDRLDSIKAPGQSYNGFITQLLQHWEGGHSEGGVIRRPQRVGYQAFLD
jgi:hypothetical protein